MQKQYVNQTDAAKLLGVCTYTIRNMEKDGRLTRDSRFRSPRYSIAQLLGQSAASQPQQAA
jgi:DNA-binding XRE family transcriptional regulator